MPKVADVMAELESLGTAQNRKIYARHGAQPPMFGVSFANFGRLAKRLRVDHDLALGLWRTGNLDARILATMIADPARMDVATAEEWARGCTNYGLADAICRPIGASPVARLLADRWRTADDEWFGTAGWNLVAILTSDATVPDAYFEPLIATIEREIHGRKNRVRYAMNNALIAIGIRSAGLRGKATAAARRIGTVDVDHGETGCKTPDAVSYIAKAAARKQATPTKAAARPRSAGKAKDGARKVTPRAASVRHRIREPRDAGIAEPSVRGAPQDRKKGRTRP